MSEGSRVGFIGLGNMGRPMAAAIARAGLTPHVYDIRPEAARALEADGAVPAADVGELIETCDVISTCLLYDHQVREAFLGPGGIVPSGRKGQVAVIHSTVMPQTVKEIAVAAAEKGIGIIDAPVSGGGDRSGPAAVEGTLTLMIGAADWAFEKARPALEAVAVNLFRVGEPGAGQIVKLGNNIMALCNQIVHMEAIRFVESFGVDRQALDATAMVSSGKSWAVANFEHFDRYDIEHTLAGTRELPHRLGKDLRYAVAVAQDEHTYLPVVALCSQLLPAMFEERWIRNGSRPAKDAPPRT